MANLSVFVRANEGTAANKPASSSQTCIQPDFYLWLQSSESEPSIYLVRCMCAPMCA